MLRSAVFVHVSTKLVPSLAAHLTLFVLLFFLALSPKIVRNHPRTFEFLLYTYTHLEILLFLFNDYLIGKVYQHV